MDIKMTRKGSKGYKPSETKQERPCQKEGCSGSVFISMADILEKREFTCDTCNTTFNTKQV